MNKFFINAGDPEHFKQFLKDHPISMEQRECQLVKEILENMSFAELFKLKISLTVERYSERLSEKLKRINKWIKNNSGTSTKRI